MVNLEAHPALKKYVGSVEAGVDTNVLEAELVAAKKELEELSNEQREVLLKELGHIKGLGSVAERALEDKEVVQGGKVRRRSRSKKKTKSTKKKSKSPRKKKH